MSTELAISLIVLGLNIGTVLFAAGRLTGRLDLIAQEQRAARELNEAQQNALATQLNNLGAELTRVRDDRHNLLGTVMRHEGAIGEHGKQIVHLDHRVTRLEENGFKRGES